MHGFVKRLVDRATLAAQELGLSHPFIFQNHAGEKQRVFSGYSARNQQRLVDIQQRVDPTAIMTALQPGYFKLQNSALSSDNHDHDEL
jgi:hypothetical protein